MCLDVTKKWPINQHVQTMQVLDFSPMKESLRTLVKVLIRKGTWSLFLPSERIHSFRRQNTMLVQNMTFVQFQKVLKDTQSYFYGQVQKHTITLGSVGEPWQKPNFTLRASRLRLISAVSIKVVRSLLLTSVPRSFPAKSTNENLPCSVEARLLRRKEIWRTACERDELLLAEVWPDVLGWRRKKKHGRGLYSLTGKTGKHNQKQINTFKKKKKIYLL